MKPKLLLIGGGGHAKACIDVIEQQDKFEIAGLVEKPGSLESVLGYPILGSDEDLELLRKDFDFALVSVGQIKSPNIRIKLFTHLKELGFTIPVIISPRSYVSCHAEIEEGTIIMHDVCINANAKVGKNCIINTKALIEHDAIIEDHCHISTAAIINGGTKIRAGSFVGSNAVTKEYVISTERDFIKAGSLFKGYING